MKSNDIQDVAPILECAVTRSINSVLAGPSGIHIKIRCAPRFESIQEWIDILCCGRMVFVAEDGSPVVLMNGSSYLNRGACEVIPLDEIVSSFEIDTKLNAFALLWGETKSISVKPVRNGGRWFGFCKLMEGDSLRV